MLNAAYLAVPKVRANLVQGPSGQFVDETGSSRGISNDADLQRLLELRKLADILVTDGETARKESYRVPDCCDLAVITRNGFTPREGKSTRAYIELRKNPVDAIRYLKNLGYERVLLEVGPTVLSELVADGLVDQICLTNTGGSNADLSRLAVATATQVLTEQLGDTTFTVWGEIQP